MKKLFITLATVMVAGIVSAQIWSESFSTNAPPTIINDGSANITNEYPTMTWTAHRFGNRTTLNSDGTLRIRVNNWTGDNHGGKSEGCSIPLDDSYFPTAGVYRLTVDISAMQLDGILGVGIYDADIGSGGVLGYYKMQNVTYAGPGTNAPNVVVASTEIGSDASVTLLARKFFNASHNGVRSIDFTYDGSGDVAVMLSAISQTSSANRWVEITEITVDAASANPDLPSFFFATNTVTPEAEQYVAYSNTTFVTGATDNPGFETLYYSAKDNLAPGLEVSTDGTIFGTPTQGGTNTLIISVADADGAYDEALFTLVVDDVDDPPEFYSPPAYGDNIFWAGNALVGLAYSMDLNSYVGDPEGAELTFSATGPAWLTIAVNGICTGTPGPDDYYQNSWEIIASDGSLSSTGTLNIAVEKRDFIHIENFDTNAPPNVVGSGTSFFPSLSQITTTTNNGTWYKGGGNSVVTEDGTLRFVRPSDPPVGGTSGLSIVFDETLFVNGAGTYEIRLKVDHLTGNQATVWYEVYDVDFGVGGTVEVPNAYYASPAIMPPITATNGAVATLITNVTSSAAGNRTIAFEYDGAGDVLFRLGAGKNNANDWWRMEIDNFKLLGPSLVTPLQDWAFDFGLKGAAADGANDPDGDGWPLLYDYGLGLNPTNSATDGGAYPTNAGTPTGMVYIHALRTSDPSLVYSIDTNPNLTIPGGWTDHGDDFVTGVNVTTGAFNYVTNTIPATDPELFIRLVIEE